MWDWCFSSSSSFNPFNKNQHLSIPFLYHPRQSHLPLQLQEQYNSDDAADAPSNFHQPLSAFTMIFTSWLRRNTCRCLILALCSPLLLPLFCATFPCLFVLEVFFRLCRRRSRKRKRKSMDSCDGDRMSEDATNGEKLLQRYLEDQLILVAGSVCQCRDDDHQEDDLVDIEYFDNRSPPLQSGQS